MSGSEPPSPSTPATVPAFGTLSTSPFLSSPFTSPTTQKKKRKSRLFQQPAATGSSFLTPSAPAASPSSPFSDAQLTTPMAPVAPAASPSSPFPDAQLTTQMVPVVPLPFSRSDRDVLAIVEAFKDEAGNPNSKYAFKHLLFSVTDLQYRAKPEGVLDIMWAEAIAKLEGMEKADRERLWPQLVQGFKDLSQRLKIQDEVVLSDAERLQMIRSSVKMLRSCFLVDTLSRVQRLKLKEQGLQRRLLRVMRIMEALESKGQCRVLPVVKGEAELALITRQLKGSEEELSRRVQNLLTTTRGQANGSSAANSISLQGFAKIHEQSLADMRQVLQKQTEAIARLGNVLKRDVRDIEIIMAEDKAIIDDAS